LCPFLSDFRFEPFSNGDTNGFSEYYLYDVPSGELSRLDESDFPFNRWSNRSLVYNAENDLLIFESNDPTIIPNDQNLETDIFKVSLKETLDSDSDGLFDSWERKHFLSLSESGDGDADHDGLTNAQELILRTIPVDPASKLFLTAEHDPSDLSLVRIRVEPRNPQLRYFLDRTPELGAAWESTPLDPSASSAEFKSERSMFYRVRVH